MGPRDKRFQRGARSTLRPAAAKRRSQRVRFRKRYANSVLTKVKTTALVVVQIAVVVGFVGWGVLALKNFWSTTPLTRISDVIFTGSAPPALAAKLKLFKNKNIFQFDPQPLEAISLLEHPELKSISIERTLRREVVVVCKYREPVATFMAGQRPMGVDESGVVFPLRPDKPAPAGRPVILGSAHQEALAAVLEMARTLEKKKPDFYSLISEIETDKIHRVRVRLKNGVEIFWGELTDGSVLDKAGKVQIVLEKFSPRQKFGGQASKPTMRFIANDRVVIDDQWSDVKIAH